MSLTVASLLLVSIVLSLTILPASQATAQPYTWENTHTSPAECVAFNPLSGGKTLFFASGQQKGVFRSDDGGMTWLQYWQGMPDITSAGLMQIHCLESDTNILLAVSTSQGVFRSTNGGQTWGLSLENGGILGEAITWHKQTDALYYGQNYKGPIWKSIDHGATWQQSGEPSEEVVLCTIAVSPDEKKWILAGSGDGGIALSTVEGASWQTVFPEENPEEIIRPEVPKIVWSLYTPGVVLATRWLSQDSQLIRSTNWGQDWSVIGLDLPRTWALELDQRQEHAGLLGQKRFWIGLFNRGLEPNEVHSVIETHDAGETWIGTGITSEIEQVWMIKHDTTSDRLVAATNLGIFITTARASVKPEAPPSSIRFSNNPAIASTEAIIPKNDLLQSIEVFDAAGRHVLTTRSATVTVSLLANGSYNTIIKTTSGTYHVPLVVQH